jgi:cytochrome c oxidase assembly protein subunit 15
MSSREAFQHGTPARPVYRQSPHWLAILAAVFTLPLLFVGGSVTTYRVGLAVPDWPSTFGINMFLYDFWNAPFGVRVEHAHRLYGAAVGLASIGLMCWLLYFESRPFVKMLGVLALVAVIVQGVLGGTRVTQVSTFLAAVHGCTGQAFFGLMVALCVLTGRNWLSMAQPTVDTHRLRRASLILLGLVYGQIVLGAWLRHYGTIAALTTHGLVAAGVLVGSFVLAWRIGRNRLEVPALVMPAQVLAIGAVIQVVLGIVTLVYLLPWGGIPRPVEFYEALVRTGHQTNAALLLASSIVLALRSLRNLRAWSRDDFPHQSLTTAPGKPSAPASLEVIA